MRVFSSIFLSAVSVHSLGTFEGLPTPDETWHYSVMHGDKKCKDDSAFEITLRAPTGCDRDVTKRSRRFKCLNAEEIEVTEFEGNRECKSRKSDVSKLLTSDGCIKPALGSSYKNHCFTGRVHPAHREDYPIRFSIHNGDAKCGVESFAGYKYSKADICAPMETDSGKFRGLRINKDGVVHTHGSSSDGCEDPVTTTKHAVGDCIETDQAGVYLKLMRNGKDRNGKKQHCEGRKIRIKGYKAKQIKTGGLCDCMEFCGDDVPVMYKHKKGPPSKWGHCNCYGRIRDISFMEEEHPKKAHLYNSINFSQD